VNRWSDCWICRITCAYRDEYFIIFLKNSVSWGQQPYAGSSLGEGVGVIGSNSRTEITLTFIVFTFSSSNIDTKKADAFHLI
jgi:hypothetical protein